MAFAAACRSRWRSWLREPTRGRSGADQAQRPRDAIGAHRAVVSKTACSIYRIRWATCRRNCVRCITTSTCSIRARHQPQATAGFVRGSGSAAQGARVAVGRLGWIGAGRFVAGRYVAGGPPGSTVLLAGASSAAAAAGAGMGGPPASGAGAADTVIIRRPSGCSRATNTIRQFKRFNFSEHLPTSPLADKRQYWLAKPIT